MKTENTFKSARIDDITKLAETLALSFNNDPVIGWLIRNDDHRSTAIRDFFDFTLELYMPFGGVVTNDELDACAIWLPPEAQSATPKSNALSVLRRIISWTTIWGVRKLLIMNNLENQKSPRFPHRHLAFIGVRPDRQGKGIGSKLLEHTLNEIDLAGLPAYLESSNPRNMTLYERHGFKVIDIIRLPKGPNMSCMMRMPQLKTEKN